MAKRKELPRGESGRYLRQYEPQVVESGTFRSWVSMRQRCTDQNVTCYENYGGRGITFCDRWDSFRCFLADMGERPPGTSLDRIDVNGNYEPGNCRWATPKQQTRNQRNNHLLRAFGELKTLIEWTEDARCSVTFGTLRHRLVRYGWDAERAIATPSRPKLPPGQSPRYEQKRAYYASKSQSA